MPYGPSTEAVVMGQRASAVSTPDATSDEGRNDVLDAMSPKRWRQRIEHCKRERKDLIRGWADNVDYRRGKPFGEYDDEERVNVNLDWTLTKGKHAQLYSQTPQVYLTAKNEKYAPAIRLFQKELNDKISEANAGAAIDEAVMDTINASGIGCAIVYMSRLTQDKLQFVDESGVPFDMGQVPPELQAQVLQNPKILESQGITQQNVPITTSVEFGIDRFSPSELLWPVDFDRSDFNKANWLGRSGRIGWAEAKRRFKLSDDLKEKVCVARSRTSADEDIRRNTTNEYSDDEPMVEFDDIYYWAHEYDPECKYHKQINNIVFVSGLDKPVINGPWEGQKFLEDQDGSGLGKYIGSCLFPIQALTFTYISDDAIPPSDTAVGRPQIEEMIRSRTQIVMNRDRSQPLRWGNTNLLDPQVLDLINRGEWQTIIPVNGPGDKVLGEVARAAYPHENWEFDATIKDDLREQWNMGPNQMGAFASGRRSAAEAQNTQAAFDTRIGYERARVADYVVRLATVLGGLLALYGDFDILTDEEEAAMDASWDRRTIGNEVVYWIRPDSTVLLDANQRIERISKTLNLTGPSGFVNPKPLIQEIVELSGCMKEGVIVDPPPPKQEPPNISYRFSGDDLQNPFVIALLVHTNQAPTPEDLQAAQKILQAAGVSMLVPPQAPVEGQPPEMPQGPAAAPAAPTGPTPDQMNVRPEWHGLPKVFKRSADMEG